jgi:hypothetical protein
MKGQPSLPGVGPATLTVGARVITREHRAAVVAAAERWLGESVRGVMRTWVETGEWHGEDRMHLRMVESFALLAVEAEARGAERALGEVLSVCIGDGISFDDAEVAALRRKLGLP